MLDSVIKDTGPDPRWTILWLHGLGADGHDFEPIVPELVDPAWPALRFVFPHAPVRPVSINNGMPMRAWYDIKALSLDERADQGGIDASVAEVETLITAENARGTAADHIILAGFSQGGVLALHAGLRHGRALAGIVGLSCYLPLADTLKETRSTANASTPLLLMHGTMDPVVPLAMGEHARSTLESWGHAPQWRTYPMQHQVSLPQILDLRRWLGTRLNAGA